ncbi:MAG: single-stranded DNA-binding protein [Bacillota bacterium]|nr:single-stranded DNA-binding protein [Bacillota bacterium]
MNKVVLIGRLTRDPELRYLATGNNAAVARFTLAVDKQLSKEKKLEMESRNQPTADFISIVVWGKLAETVANYTAKGRLVAVSGRIQTGSYEKDGRRIYTTDVVADSVQFLEWADNPNRSSRNDSYDNLDNNNYNDSNPSDDVSEIEGFFAIDNEDIPF